MSHTVVDSYCSPSTRRRVQPGLPAKISVGDVKAQKVLSATSGLFHCPCCPSSRSCADFLPNPTIFEANNAPIPKPMPAALMKIALLSLSTPDMLSELPAKTINLLLFNYATEA
ncbi:hypothetical protein MPER_05376 [Moniliophthora perniciosa FA553]|nr:hypothetical protein MPER_05376 [Moniliophthora perniciosa FA553]